LNLHFKLGIISIVDVPFFNDEERVFVERMESATTTEEVVAISRDLYLHSAKECEGRHQKGPQGYSDISGENTGNGKEGGEEGEEGDGESNNTTGSLGGHYAGPMTASAFNNIARAEPERYRYEEIINLSPSRCRILIVLLFSLKKSNPIGTPTTKR